VSAKGTCPRCGQSFRLRDPGQVYCSKTCRVAAQRNRDPDSPRSVRSYQRWSCGRKQLQFATEAEALAVMAEINANPENRLREPLRSACSCDFGDHWHLTSQDQPDL